MPMDKKNTDLPTDPSLETFFGDAWNFAPNATFSDLDPVGDLTMHQGPPEFDDYLDAAWMASSVEAPRSVANQYEGREVRRAEVSTSSKGVTREVSGPNLYDCLKAQTMTSHVMMPVSPYNGYTDMMGMEWRSPSMMPNNMMPNNMMPTMDNPYMQCQPPMTLDQQLSMMMQARIKQRRMSPYLGPMGYDGMMQGYMSGMNRNRFGKIPLSPVTRMEKSPLETDGNIKPLLFVSSPSKKSDEQSTDQRQGKILSSAMSMPPLGVAPRKRPSPTHHVENNIASDIENNLKSFLKDTEDLQWDSVTVIELKGILRQYELNATGKKAELINRITKIRQSYIHRQDQSHEAPSKVTKGEEMQRNDFESRSKVSSETLDLSSPDSMGSVKDFSTSAKDLKSSLKEDIDSFFSITMNAGHEQLLFE